MVGLDWRGKEGWGLRNVLGVANTPVPSGARSFAEHLAERYQVFMSRSVQTCFGRDSDIGEILVGLDEAPQSNKANM